MQISWVYQKLQSFVRQRLWFPLQDDHSFVRPWITPWPSVLAFYRVRLIDNKKDKENSITNIIGTRNLWLCRANNVYRKPNTASRLRNNSIIFCCIIDDCDRTVSHGGRNHYRSWRLQVLLLESLGDAWVRSFPWTLPRRRQGSISCHSDESFHRVHRIIAFITIFQVSTVAAHYKRTKEEWRKGPR